MSSTRFLLRLGVLSLFTLLFAAPAVLSANPEPSRRDLLYVCDCGAGCGCNTVKTEPGDCACGKPLRWHHVVKVEGETALLCSCNAGCKCAIDPADSSKCGCGKAVKRVDLKGTGLHFCNCGGACTCNTVAAGPGECRCGMPLRQAN